MSEVKSSNPESLYKTLNLEKDAMASEIKKAYRRLAKEIHPDRNPTAGDRFKEISYAYWVLSDPQRRAHYDHDSENSEGQNGEKL